MNDFELQRDLRALRGPRAPSADLWPRIAAGIDAESARRSTRVPRRWLPLGIAAALALAMGTGIALLAIEQPSRSDMAEVPLSVREQIERARELALTGDPRLASAEVVIDTATGELEQALQQQPDAVFLVGLINRTHAQRRKLARLGMHAG
jgi:hypothetical protein